jgi:hypothetical protein
MLPKTPFRKCEDRSRFWNGGRDGSEREVSVPVFRMERSQRERELITATKIGRWGDIAVMAQFQRNAGIHVALSAGEVPRGIAIIKGC